VLGEVTDERRELVRVVERGDAIERGLERVEAIFLDEPGIHAGGVEVAVLFLQRTFGGIRRGVELLPEVVAVALAQQREGAGPADLVGGNGIVLDPVAAGVLVEVGAGVGVLIDS